MSAIAPAVQNTVVWGGFRIWQRNRDAFLRSWKVEIGGLAIEPFIMLVAVGFGLGSYISNLGGDMRYAEFIAPGVIASYAMFHATFDASYGAYLRMETHHIYEAVLFTPLGPEDIVVGEVMWGATRGLISGTFVVIVAASFGLLSSPYAVLAIPVSYLIGVTFASIAMVMTSSATTIGAFNNFFTLFILPMFWVSGVFFPLDRLPQVVQTLAWVLPLTPAAKLVRGLVEGNTTPYMLLWTAELMAFAVVSLWLASILMRRRLIK